MEGGVWYSSDVSRITRAVTGCESCGGGYDEGPR